MLLGLGESERIFLALFSASFEPVLVAMRNFVQITLYKDKFVGIQTTVLEPIFDLCGNNNQKMTRAHHFLCWVKFLKAQISVCGGSSSDRKGHPVHSG